MYTRIHSETFTYYCKKLILRGPPRDNFRPNRNLPSYSLAEDIMPRQVNNRRPWAKCAYFFQNQWWVLTCLGIMSSAREYEGRLRFSRKLSHGAPLNKK